jgi:hypothetical protein
VAQAVEGRLVLLHVNRPSLLDSNDLVAQSYHQEELARQTDTSAILYQQADGLLTTATVKVSTDLALETSAPLPPDARPTAHARSATRRYRSWAFSNAAPMVLLK